MNLFTPIVEVESLHSNFINTLADDAIGVRKVLQEWAQGFVDRDRKFIKEFQTTYNSSFWELYLFAVLKDLHIDVDFSYSSPDFVSIKSNLVVEAIIASNADDDTPEWGKLISDEIKKDTFDIYKRVVIRLANAFSVKLQKYRSNYCKLKHVKDKPFIIAISNYSRPGFSLHGDVSMQWLLYDVLDDKVAYKNNGASIPLGLFRTEAFSDVSAVLYSSLATFGKARALGGESGNFIFHAVRIKNNFNPIKIVANKLDYKESLLDGLRLFINPFAKHPIEVSNFENEGIRMFAPDKNGNLHISCHKDGDLCMRFVYKTV